MNAALNAAEALLGEAEGLLTAYHLSILQRPGKKQTFDSLGVDGFALNVMTSDTTTPIEALRA